MNVSIIIVNYNTKEITSNCLESIVEQTKDISYEVIIVDNASTDGSQNTIKNNFPQFKLIESNENLGFGRGNNKGLELAKGKYLFFLNSDTILLNNAIKIFYDFMENHNLENNDVGALGSILLDQEQKPTHSSGVFPRKSILIKHIICRVFDRQYYRKQASKEIFTLNEKKYIDVQYITGADLFVPALVIQKIGAFDPHFFMYYEETDLQKRMYNIGLRRLIIDGPQIIHLEGSSTSSVKTEKVKNIKRIMTLESMFKYIKKHSWYLNYLFFRILYIILKIPVELIDRRYTLSEKKTYIKTLLRGI